MIFTRKLIESLLRHAKVVAEGFDSPTAKVKDNVRLLKKDIDKIEQLNKINNHVNK